jgi:predicted transcriptional regulator
MVGRGVESIGVGDVSRVIGPEVIGRDMDLELSGLLRGSEKGLAVAAISALMVEGEMNQKDLASRLGVSQTMVSRLVGKLDGLGYVRRVHVDRKEFRVSLKNVS